MSENLWFSRHREFRLLLAHNQKSYLKCPMGWKDFENQRAEIIWRMIVHTHPEDLKDVETLGTKRCKDPENPKDGKFLRSFRTIGHRDLEEKNTNNILDMATARLLSKGYVIYFNACVVQNFAV